MASKRSKKKKPPVHDAAFAGRTVGEDTEVATYVESEIVGPDGTATMSSLPHLTKVAVHEKTKKVIRKAHVTSSRVLPLRASQIVAVSPNFVIHQRFHQDDDGQSKPTHDRYFAVDQRNGNVHKATGKLDKTKHLGRKDVLPSRTLPLDETSGVHEKMVFTVAGRDEKVPPLSPRSIRRTLTDKGHIP